MAEPFLIGEAMTGGYGAVDILHSCTLAVDPGEIAVIVGPNGAGKSTAMKAVFGMLKLRQGRLRLAGEDITQLTPQARVRKGMGFVPQTSNIFTTMTVEENLEMGAFIRTEDSIPDTMAQVYDLFPILKLEEFFTLGPMPSIEKAAGYAAGFGVKLWAILQDLQQLKALYPSSWQTSWPMQARCRY